MSFRSWYDLDSQNQKASNNNLQQWSNKEPCTQHQELTIFMNTYGIITKTDWHTPQRLSPKRRNPTDHIFLNTI